LINIPIASFYEPGEIEFGLATGVYSYSKYENDFKLNYSVSEKLIFGFTWMNSENVVGNVHATFFEIGRNPKVLLGGGLLYLTSSKYVSSWDEYSSNKTNTMSNYLVSTFQFKNKLNIYVGRGKKRFETLEKSEGILGSLQSLGGIFFGFDFPILGGKLMGEFDGSDINLGMKYTISNKTEINLALTEMFIKGPINPESQAPVRYFTFSVCFKENIFESYRKKFKDTNIEIERLNKIAKILENQKKISDTKKENEETENLKEKDIIRLYNESFEANYAGKK
jgi:hypothetical protein